MVDWSWDLVQEVLCLNRELPSVRVFNRSCKMSAINTSYIFSSFRRFVHLNTLFPTDLGSSLFHPFSKWHIISGFHL